MPMRTGTLPWTGDLPFAQGADLATLTTMATPGVAQLVVTPPDPPALQRLLRDLAAVGEPFILLGSGSNVIFTRTEVCPIIIRLGHGFDHIELLGRSSLRVGVSTQLTHVLRFALRNRLAGLEWAVGIPGTVGGAAVGNAGAAGSAIGDHLVRVEAFTRAGEPVTLGPAEIRCEYRDTNLRHLVLTTVELRLQRGERAAIVAAMRAHRARRRHQPYGEPSSGCIFRNPEGDHAGRLIDAAGLKGLSVGQARVSPAHANFLVNDGAADPQDVLTLIEEIRFRVREQTGVELITEVILLDPQAVEPARLAEAS
jgi:UDP-N-acetylmuramate dehydrogenase